MNEYRVSWAIQVTADSPLNAARQARELQLDPDSRATVFIVDQGVEIDLEAFGL